MSAPGARALFVAEPAAAWLQRAPVVADCSVLAALLWGEAAAEQAAAGLGGKSLHAPSLLSYEMANVARTKCRAGVPAEVALAGLTALAELRVVLHEVEAPAMFELARRYQLSAYDAAYLCLSALLKAPLLTFDHRLGEAAARHLAAPD